MKEFIELSTYKSSTEIDKTFKLNVSDIVITAGPVRKLLRAVDVNAIVGLLSQGDVANIEAGALAKLVEELINVYFDIVEDLIVFNFKGLKKEDLDNVDITQLIDVIGTILIATFSKYANLISIGV